MQTSSQSCAAPVLDKNKIEHLFAELQTRVSGTRTWNGADDAD